MPTKQEIISMMENHLPGEPVSIGATNTSTNREPPAYPTLEPPFCSEHLQQPQHQGTFDNGQVYAITTAAAPINHPPAQFGARPHLVYCPSCRSQKMSRVTYQSTIMTHIIAAVLCFTTCSCCLPYLFDNCKSARHYCSQCDTYLGAQVK